MNKNNTLDNKTFTPLRLVIIISGLLGFATVAYLVVSGNASFIDDPIRQSFYELRNPVLNSVISTFTHLGDAKSITAICIIFLLIRPVRKSFGLPLAAGAVGISILNKSIKHIVERPRPDDILHLVNESGFSFPSGHSITSMLVFGLMIWLVHKYVTNPRIKTILTILLLIPTIGIGLSRIYCGVHYPSDVLGGWFLGLAALALETGILYYSSIRSNTQL